MSSEKGCSEGAVAPFAVPDLSIIIPVHNQWRLTQVCIASLLKHPPSLPFEIVVVNDGSSDETVPELERLNAADPRIRPLCNLPPHRFARACNAGAFASCGSLLLFMNNDIEAILDGWCDPLVALLQQNPEVGIAVPLLLFPDGRIQHCGKVWRLDEAGMPRSEHFLYEQPADLPAARQGGAFLTVTGACMLMRREQFFSVGPFDEAYENGWEDDDLCFAFRRHGLLSWVCPQSVMIHHQGGTLKAEAVVLERYLKLLRDKKVMLQPEDPLLSGLAQRARDQAERFDAAWHRNQNHFIEKWRDCLDPLLLEHPADDTASASIIVVTYNSAATIAACLASIQRTIRPGDGLIIIDNASRDETLSMLEQWGETFPLRLIRNRVNKGYAVAANQGIRCAHTPYVVLLNPDTVVTAGWLARLQKSFSNSSVAAVGPVSNFAAGRQSVAVHWKGPLPESSAPEQAAAELAAMQDGGVEKTGLLIGFCLMLRRELASFPVLMDERLFLGNDDLELSWRLRLQGYELLIAKDCFIYHEGQHSFRSDPATTTGRLVQESSAALYQILASCYGAGRVPPPEALWNVEWFEVEGASWNNDVSFDQVLFQPVPWLCPDHLVSIIILTFNQWSYTEECLAAIARHTPEPYELIIVDNGSTDGTVEQLRRLADSNELITLVLNQENLGYAAGCNQGIRAARGEYLVLLNNDVVVTPEWLSGLLECHRSHPDAGVVGPMTNQASGMQLVVDAEYELPAGLDAFSRFFRVDNRFCIVMTERVVGFCMLLHRSLTEKIGLLDETFGSGNYEDDDFCLRAAIEGFQNLVAADVYLHHYGSVTFTGNRIDYRSALSRNAALFSEKWRRPVTDPEIEQKIEAYRFRRDLELLFLDEQMTAVYGKLHDALHTFPHDRLLQGLALRVQSAASQVLMTGSSRGCALACTGLEVLQQDGQTAYAEVLMRTAFRLEPWRPQLIAWMLACGQSGTHGLATMADQACRLYPASRGLARLRVQLAALEGLAVAVAWAEQFFDLFGFDAIVLDAGLQARRSIGSYTGRNFGGKTVSLCMIVKNEEKNLACCLASCKPFVTELVVVDTGSSDSTMAIAELFGAVVDSYPWQGDFSAARNRSLDLTTSDWLLVMDADEALSMRDYEVFEKLLAESDSRTAYVMITRNYTMSYAYEGFVPCRGEYPEREAGVAWTPSDKVRLFPARSNIHFSGRIHEMVEPSLQAGGFSVVCHPMPVHHYGGLDNSRLVQKRKEYLAIGLKKLEASPDDPKALYELAIQAAELGQYGLAETLWRELLIQQPLFAKGWFNLGYVLLRQGKCKEAQKASTQALTLDATLKDALVNRALAEACLLTGEEALHSAEHALAERPRNPVLMVLLAVAFYRVAKAEKGGQLLALLESSGIACRPVIEGLLHAMELAGGTNDHAALRQAADELPDSSAANAAAASSSSCS